MAIMVALFVVALFASAAMSVDLGNAWARKRAVQRQVDVSAMGAGYLLPMTPANEVQIATEVASYLNQNHIAGQQTVAASDLLNLDDADGEVTFQDSNGAPCATGCTQMTVVAPRAEVNFGMARLIGFSSTTVSRTASVRVVSALPPKDKLLPFWLPSGCAMGPAQADTTGGNGGPSTTTLLRTVVEPAPAAVASSSTTPTATATTSTFVPPLAVGTHLLAGVSPWVTAQGTTVTVSGYVISNLPSSTDRASIRFYSPDGSSYVDYATQSAGGLLTVPAFQVGTEVTSTPGDWTVYALAQKKGNGTLTVSSTSLIFRVTPTGEPTPTPTPTATPTDTTTSPSPSSTGIPVGCVGQDRGNFGQLDSPRRDGSTGNKLLARNVAMGLDHQLVPFLAPADVILPKDCGSTNKGFITGAQPDNTSTDGRNCIIGDTGNDGPAIFDGLVSGIDGVAGRLSATAHPTTCPNRSNASVGGFTVNNDVLSCFLRNGATLSSIAQPTGVTGAMLDPLVVESPRFVWLPVVVATDRAQKNFQPILDFVPAFITDETQTTSASAANGLDINGNSVQTLHVFTFSKDALPIDEQSTSIDYQPLMHQSIVRLVD